MSRKTVVIQFVMEGPENQRQTRERLYAALADKEHPLYQALTKFGWSGNPFALGTTVSNPFRTAHWPL